MLGTQEAPCQGERELVAGACVAQVLWPVICSGI